MKRTPLLTAVLALTADAVFAQRVTFVANTRPLFSATPAAAWRMDVDCSLPPSPRSPASPLTLAAETRL